MLGAFKRMSPAEQAWRTFQIVVAATKQWGIGKGEPRCLWVSGRWRRVALCCHPHCNLLPILAAGGSLPWSLPGDMKYFKELTSRTADPAKQARQQGGRVGCAMMPADDLGLRGFQCAVAMCLQMRKGSRLLPPNLPTMHTPDALPVPADTHSPTAL